MWNRLGIGTAAWGKSYRGHRVPEQDIMQILDYAQCHGIDFIDTATAYQCDDIMKTMVPDSFHIQCKVLGNERPDWASSFISHDSAVREGGASIYNDQAMSAMLNRPWIVQLPYSIVDRTAEQFINEHDLIFQARSIFCGGQVFTGTHPNFVRLRVYAALHRIPVGTLCILFVLMNPNIDKVIIGADSFKQFRENLEFFETMDSFQSDDKENQ